MRNGATVHSRQFRLIVDAKTKPGARFPENGEPSGMRTGGYDGCFREICQNRATPAIYGGKAFFACPFPLRQLFIIVIIMKVLLVQPPVEDFYDTSIRTYPLGLLYLAAAVREVADAVVLDARTGYRAERLEHGFPELEPFYREKTFTPFSLFTRYGRFGLHLAATREIIEKERPDVVAVSSMCSAYERQALEMAAAAKEVNREIRTVMGGVHPTVFPERILACRDVDYCIRGEGETPLFKLLSALSSGRVPEAENIAGLCFREEGRPSIRLPAVESDMELLPARQLIDPDRYRIGGKRYAFFLTSRGCPFSCGFCGKPPVPYRRRRIESIEEEIDACAGLGIRAIDFEDDMLNLDRQFFRAVLGLFFDRGMTLSAMNGIYPAHVDIPTLKLMHRAGFRRLNFSLVDLSEPVVAAQGRNSQRSFVRLLPWLDGSPFLVEVHFIVGMPGQRPTHVLETLCFLMGQRVLLGPSIFYFSPGSPMAATLAPTADVPLPSMRSSVMLPLNPLFPREVTYTFVKLARFINYTKRLIDGQAGLAGVRDLPAHLAADERTRTILARLLAEKRFVCYDTGTGRFRDEPVEPGLVAAFFERAKGLRIKGYRTSKSLIVDV